MRAARVSRRTRMVQAPAETAVLTPAQLATWLQVSERQIERWDGVPWFYVGGSRSKRVLVRDVLRWLEDRRSTTP